MYEPAMESNTPSTPNEELLALLAEDASTETEVKTEAEKEAEAELEAKEGELVTEAEMAEGLPLLPLPADAIQREIPRGPLKLPYVEPELAITGDPLTIFLSQIRQIPVLPADQQQALAERFFKTGDRVAANTLMVTNLRLVVKIAHQYQRRNGELMEIIQEGSVGLMEAVRRYDPYRGVKFTSYAQYWVKALILNYVMNSMQLIKVGNTRAGRRLFYNLKKARRELEAQGLLSPTTLQIAEHLGVEEREVIDVGHVLEAKPVAFDAPVAGEGSKTYAEVIADTRSLPVDEEVGQRMMQAKIALAFETFRSSLKNDRERAIWDRRVANDEPESLQEIGETFNVSRERIRQIEKALKDDFRKFWRDTVGATDAELTLLG